MAMRHRLQWFIHLRTHGLKKGDERRQFSSQTLVNGSVECRLKQKSFEQLAKRQQRR